jgi:beta-phosphoglucomutase-like phosphatase (HAD superfamily)
MTFQFRALIFDCDGVLAETERDGHRVAFNRTFADKGYGVEWDVALYKELLKVGGGKERMRHFFEQTSWPQGTTDKDALIKELHKAKTDCYMQMVESGQLPLRPGVARLVDEAIAAGVKLAVCSTSNERAVNAVVETLLGGPSTPWSRRCSDPNGRPASMPFWPATSYRRRSPTRRSIHWPWSG